MIVGGRDLSLSDFYKVLYQDEKIEIANEALDRVQKSFTFLQEFSAKKVIYGINTGFGPMAQFAINDSDKVQLQYNLVCSHAAGTGKAISDLNIRAALLVMLNNLSQGYSGIHSDLIKLIAAFINKGLIPFVPEHGGVGASGDLVQLAHIGLNLIGKGEIFYKNNLKSASEVFSLEGLKPLKIRIREGLAMINGTSVMTGISLVNVMQAKQLLNWSIAASAVINEIVNSFGDYFSEELNRVKRHPGQQYIAQKMRWLIQGSALSKKRENEFYNGNSAQEKFKTRVQEFYSIRCIPQILGPIYDTILAAEKLFINEANSVHDNPVVDFETKNVYHGGNFHGDYVSFESDKLKIAITKLSMIIERQLNFLMNNKLNELLPPFVNLGTLGLNLGMQGVQFTATSTTAENQTLSFPMYVHSIPNNNDNQDIVSMGTNSALLTQKVIENACQVMAIELIAIIQAVDHLSIENDLSEKTKKIYDALRLVVPVFVEDTPKYKEIRNMTHYIRNTNIEDVY